MGTMKITLTKKSSGESAIACARPDGSVTWQRHSHAFFPLHDLTHFAVETTLDLRHGFFGLLAAGWEIGDFGHRKIPEDARHDAMLAEAIAGMLDQERATGIIPEADDFNEGLLAVMESLGIKSDLRLTDKQLDAIRGRFLELAALWGRTPAGGRVELEFEQGDSDGKP